MLADREGCHVGSQITQGKDHVLISEEIHTLRGGFMTIKFGAVRMQDFYTVVFEKPSKKTGKMVRQVSSYVENLAAFRASIEKRGGKIISADGPRQVETSDVYF